MPRGVRNQDQPPAATRRQPHFPRSEPPATAETTEEAKEKLEALIDEIRIVAAGISKDIASDEELAGHLDQAAASLIESINRLEDLEAEKNPRSQAMTVARTALRRYGDIDDGGPIGEHADLALDGDLDQLLTALEHYRRQPGVDPAEAEVALRRCRELLATTLGLKRDLLTRRESP